jgi:hypothetical protein
MSTMALVIAALVEMGVVVRSVGDSSRVSRDRRVNAVSPVERKVLPGGCVEPLGKAEQRECVSSLNVVFVRHVVSSWIWV